MIGKEQGVGLIGLRETFLKRMLPPLRAAGFRHSGYSGAHMKVVRSGCVKPYADRLMLAVQWLDCREAHGGNVLCRVWVAPWHDADDSLERLQIGLCLVAYDAYEFTEPDADGIVERVLAYEALVPALRGAVLAEWQTPRFPTRRAEVFLAERRLIDAVVQGQDAPITGAWRALEDRLAALRASKLSEGTVRPLAAEFVREHRPLLAAIAGEAKLPYELRDDGEPFTLEAYYSELVRRQSGG